MNKAILGIIFLMVGLFSMTHAIERTAAKIQGVQPLACVAVSSTTWTAIPSTTTVKSGRGGIIVSAPRSTAGAFNLVFTSYTVQTPSVAISSGVYEFVAGDSKDLEISEFIFLHAVTTHTAAASQPFCFQEYTLEKDR
jgi:hypothetical protein